MRRKPVATVRFHPSMATTPHRKLSRKALKQPDEFVTTLDRIGDLVAGNLTRVIIGLVAGVAAVAIGVFFSFYSQYHQRITSERFFRALRALGDMGYKTA